MPPLAEEKIIVELLQRVAALEAEVSRLKLKGSNEGLGDSLPEVEPKKRGPKPAIMESGYRQHRNNMFWFLEANWPELLVLFKKSKTSAQLYFGLQRWRTPPPDENGRYRTTSAFDQQAKFLMEHISELWEFIHSKRYAGDPRNIAYAMVGLLWGVSLRYSLDYGQKMMRGGGEYYAIGERAMLDHLRRKHPAVYQEMRAGRFGQAAATLKFSKRNCCKFYSRRPLHLAHFREVGHPDPSSLNATHDVGSILQV